MQSNSSNIMRLFLYLAVIAAIMLPVGVLLQIYMSNTPAEGAGIALLSSGTFLLIYATLFYYLGNRGQFRFPDNFTTLSLFMMVLGIALSLVPILCPSETLSFELPGPLVFAYGFVVFMMQLQIKFGIKARYLIIGSVFMDAAGILVPAVLHLFTGSVYLSLAIVPVIAGVFLLFVPMTRKNFNYWQRQRNYH